jgi:hypothetical protein
MRTTISIPDELFTAVKEWTGAASFSEFTSEALRERVLQLQRSQLAREMTEGYRAEAEQPSLDPAWGAIEVEGL